MTPGDSIKGRARAAEVLRARTAAAYADLSEHVAELRADGLSLRLIADRLNADGHTTRSGRPWNPVQVGRVLAR